MKKLGLVSLVIGGMVVSVVLGIAIGFVKESNNSNNDGVKTIPVESVGYVYENYVPEHMPTCCMEDFEEHIWELYITEYCVNYCGTCDSYSYEHCLCCECTSDEECINFDYELFIEDNMSLITNEYSEWLSWIQEDYIDSAYVVYEF